MNVRNFSSFNLLGVKVSVLTMTLALSTLETWIEEGERRYVCVANVHTVTESTRNPALRRAINGAGMVTPDGMPLVWVGRWWGFSSIERVYGPDLLRQACKYGVSRGWRHYFYGGAPGVAERLARRLQAEIPGLQVVGVESPPFRLLEEVEIQDLIQRIQLLQPHLLWVGLGAPKQELWMAEHAGKMPVPVMLGVGAAFDFLAGVKPQAPIWMQRSGLEWLFRLMSEPRRLWKRYLVNNPRFIVLVLAQTLGLWRPSQDDSQSISRKFR
jgi:N-acetylglucosaminyldiphosphoundecaprenol N-acetyl-beta-D-mannosaminyltransferase